MEANIPAKTPIRRSVFSRSLGKILFQLKLREYLRKHQELRSEIDFWRIALSPGQRDLWMETMIVDVNYIMELRFF